MKFLLDCIKHIYHDQTRISLHEPIMDQGEIDYVVKAIKSSYVSSTGEYIDKFEEEVSRYTGVKKAVATVNGTSALQASLVLSGVKAGDIVITQALTFVATCNVIKHLGAQPLFVDVSPVGLGLSVDALEEYLLEYAYLDGENCKHKITKQCIRAVVPMHTFGHPVDLDCLSLLCHKWNITIVEDAAESLGSFYKGQHTGTFGRFSALSFNGNKIITTGGGGMILCKHDEDGIHAKHITTTAKKPHAYEFIHDEAGFNFRMPNLNAALGCAQFKKLNHYLKSKREISEIYQQALINTEYQFVKEPDYAKSNYWLNAIICESKQSRNEVIESCLKADILVRPVWQPMHYLPMFKSALRGNLSLTEYLGSRLINLPSSPRIEVNCD
ncbi:LegC family aminotransferase [Bermanella sp. WJH001]|uniref:LegC family aminotransferase n=1 Tax=Bermanella sp. WJH001 TaxID=3048005 RepID=UPI0024BE5747|nr:LegC family aminotransferase [Bermanella sp. WJH001]MDJ1537765.1 LegC family aminotransferase [Bermanella sp. WJH001]